MRTIGYVPVSDGSKFDHREEAGGALVVSGCHTPAVLEPVEKALGVVLHTVGERAGGVGRRGSVSVRDH